jgi:asparagine synthase (glutamine-hydrolysing)
VKTFSIGFTYEEYNELPYARAVAERYGTEHREFIVTPDAQAIFPELVWHYNEPFADSSAIPTYYVSQLARQYVTVVLTGDGGDENFAGYPRYKNQGDYAVKRGLASVRRLLYHSDGILRSSLGHSGGLGRALKRLLALDQRKLLYYYRISHFHERYQNELYTPAFWKHLNGFATVDWMLDIYRRSDAHNFLDATLDLDLQLYLPDTLMTKMDVASMAHSLEARAPLLDHEFLEFAAQIPPELKLKDGTISKYIFKKAVTPYLPESVIERPKMGFGVPIDHWFRNELREMVHDTLLSRRALERGYFRPEYIRQMLERHQAGGESWHYMIWNLLMLELWHLMFIDRTLSIPAGHAVEQQ